MKMHSMSFNMLLDWRVEAITFKAEPTARNGQVPTLRGVVIEVDDREPRNLPLELTLETLVAQGKLS
jgi:hypothetical protein